MQVSKQVSNEIWLSAIIIQQNESEALDKSLEAIKCRLEKMGFTMFSYLRFELNEGWKGENSRLLELQYETSVNRNED